MNDQIQTKITKNLLATALKEQYESFASRDLGVERDTLENLKEPLGYSLERTVRSFCVS